MAYLEQSTRYIPYTDRRGDAWRYLVPAELDGHPLRAAVRRRHERDVRDLRALDRSDARVVRAALSEGRERFGRRLPIGHSRQGARHAARAAAGRDAVERRHLRHGAGATRRCCCGCARIRSRKCARTAGVMLAELRKVIPAFLTRVDQPERGGRWSAYLADTRERRAAIGAPARVGRGAGGSRRSDADGLRSRRRAQGRRRRALRRRRRCQTTSCWRRRGG